VAIKRIKLRKVAQEALQNELVILKKFDHPHIVKYIDMIITDHHLNLVLEYIEGGSLSQVIEKFGVFPESLVCIYMEQVLKGVSYLHEHEVVHRDLKGPNLLITKEGQVKLSDFGIALISKVNGDSSELSAAVEGSPFWMAPEVIQMSSTAPSCDIWSLGCTIIELLTGKPPYYDCSSITALYRMVEDEHPPFPTDISEELQNFMIRCFHKDPTKRPTAKELLNETWMQNVIKIKPIKSWKKTLEKVQKYNTKKRRQTQDVMSYSLKDIDWTQGRNNHIAINEEKNNGVSIATSEATSDGSIITTELFDKSISQHVVNSNWVQAQITGTEMRKNFLFYYTVYRIDVCWIESGESYVIFRSYSDFRDLDNRLRPLFRNSWNGEFPEFPTSRWFSTMEADYVIFLMSQLREYLYEIIRIPLLAHTKILSEFLHNNK